MKDIVDILRSALCAAHLTAAIAYLVESFNFFSNNNTDCYMCCCCQDGCC